MDTDSQFEKEVRRIARLLWPSAEGAGAVKIDGFEHDGVFETEECVHLVESTISRSEKKAVEDCKKMASAAEKFRKQRPKKAVKCWFITKEETTADQRTVCQSHKGLVTAQSFHQFQGRLINAADYLQMRKNHRFGSAYDPETDSFTENLNYVEIDLPERGANKLWSIREIADQLLTGRRFLFLGDYGVGKSMTLREIFLDLAARYLKSRVSQFPIYLNLREHHGQADPAEILERHGRSVGIANPSHMVRAWRAGYAVLLIDGFDEVSSLGLQGGWKRLREVRYSSMEGVRKLIRDTPKGTGIAVAGRDSFFDSDADRRQALDSGGFTEVLLSEFNEEQIKKFLGNQGYAGEVPSWIPSRPLLLGTLFSKGVRSALGDDSLQSVIGCSDAAVGWDLLLDELCCREARIEAGLSGQTIRQILETLATKARAQASGIGPLTPQEITAAFVDACGYEPADQALIVLQRLPGLGRDPSTGGVGRIFVDSELVDACRAGDLHRFIYDPYHFPRVADLTEAQVPIQETGIGVVGTRLKEDDRREPLVRTALMVGMKHPRSSMLLADLVVLASYVGISVTDRIQISGVILPMLELAELTADLSPVCLRDCYIERLEIGTQGEGKTLPQFTECLIHELDGRVSERDLPPNHFVDCVIEVYSHGTLTGSAIGELSVPDGLKVLLSILKKLFVQSLSGRQESALFRGLDTPRQHFVPEVLKLLAHHNIVTKSGRAGNTVWLPVRRQRPRVLKILQAPSSSDDVLTQEAVKII